MKNKIALILLMILFIVGISMSFYYLQKYQEAQNVNEVLIQNLYKANENYIALQEKYDSLLTTYIPQDTAAKEEIEKDKIINNALYQIGISAYKNEEKLKNVKNFVENLGFKIWYDNHFTGPGPNKGQIIYYTSQTERIALELKELLDREFNIILNPI